ncbi:MAG: VOC family protein [Alphaproteobacteria bacterium]|nr:VOC family protein [Alphaproteobacteria bacterium]
MAVQPIPAGYPAVTPYLIVEDAAAAIEFYKTVLGAKERFRLPTPTGGVGHAEIEIGGSVIMLADECPEMGARAPQGPVPVFLYVYVPDVDAVFAKALAAGAIERRAVQNQFYGDRTGTFSDPFGHAWNVATHVEDVNPAELEARAAQAMKKSA